MALADHAPERGQHGTPCSVANLLSTLDPDDAAELQTWLDGDHEHEAIWRSLKNAGYVVGRQTVGRHRRGECRCGS